MLLGQFGADAEICPKIVEIQQDRLFMIRHLFLLTKLTGSSEEHMEVQKRGQLPQVPQEVIHFNMNVELGNIYGCFGARGVCDEPVIGTEAESRPHISSS